MQTAHGHNSTDDTWHPSVCRCPYVGLVMDKKMGHWENIIMWPWTNIFLFPTVLFFLEMKPILLVIYLTRVSYRLLLVLYIKVKAFCCIKRNTCSTEHLWSRDSAIISFQVLTEQHDMDVMHSLSQWQRSTTVHSSITEMTESGPTRPVNSRSKQWLYNQHDS